MTVEAAESEVRAAAPVAVPVAVRADESLLPGAQSRPAWKNPTFLVGAVLGALALVALYYDLFAALIVVWEKDPNYSHGWFVLAGSIGFAVYDGWSNKLQLTPFVNQRESLKGAMHMGIGLCVHVLATVAQALLVDTVSLIYVLRGVFMILGGERMNRVLGFSAVFLIFMAPLPPQWYNMLALVMQQIAAWSATEGLHLLDINAVRQGYMILLDNQTDPFGPPFPVEVGAACSGLRQLTAIVALAVAIGHLSGRGVWYRSLLGMASVPIAVVSNCIRVFLTALIFIYVGREWAEGLAHQLEGLVMVGLSSLIVIGLAWLMAAYEDERAEKLEKKLDPSGKAPEPAK